MFKSLLIFLLLYINTYAEIEFMTAPKAKRLSISNSDLVRNYLKDAIIADKLNILIKKRVIRKKGFLDIVLKDNRDIFIYIYNNKLSFIKYIRAKGYVFENIKISSKAFKYRITWK